MNTSTLRQYLEIWFAKVFGLLHNSLALVGVAALLVLMLQGGRYTSAEPSGAFAPPAAVSALSGAAGTSAETHSSSAPL